MTRHAGNMAAWLALGALAATAVAQDAPVADGHFPEDEYEFDLPAAEKAALEARTCRAWHDRGITTLRAFQQYDHARTSVSIECEAHALFRKAPLHALGDCFRTAADWTCRDDGFAIDLAWRQQKAWVRFGHIAPATAVDIVQFLRKAKWEGTAVREEFAESMTLNQVDSRPDEFWLEIEHDTEQATELVAIFVTRECRGRHCRYRVTGVNHNRSVSVG